MARDDLAVDWVVCGADELDRRAIGPSGRLSPRRMRPGYIRDSADLRRWILIAAVGAVGLGALKWWDVRRTRSTRTRAIQRLSIRASLALSVLAVAIGTQLLLFAPQPQRPTIYMTPIELAGGRFYPFNIDSPGFLHLAHRPDLLLVPMSTRQSRPGYVWLSALVTRTLGPPAHWVGLDRAFGQSDSAYIPLILINALLLVAAVLLMVRLLVRLGTPAAVVASLGALLAINDITKAFWTPHQQMFELLVPVASIALASWVMRAKPSGRKIAVVGTAIGLASLMYASVLITVAVVALVLLGRGRVGVRLAALLVATFAIPQVLWIAFCVAYVGSYYSGETARYHEFVWLPQAAQRGPAALADAVAGNWVIAIRELSQTMVLPLLFLLVLTVVAVLAGMRLGPASDDQKRILVATGLTLACSIMFAFGLGLYIPRVMLHAFPAVIVLIGWVAARLAASAQPNWRLTLLAVPLATVAFMVHEVVSHGPYY